LPLYILLLLDAKNVFLIGLWLSWGSVLVPDLSARNYRKLIEQRDGIAATRLFYTYLIKT
jgi:hypothetical protein